MDYIIRECTKDDLQGIVQVITISWNETYKGIVPDEELARKKDEEDLRYKKLLKQFENNEFQQFVLEINKEIIGFIRFGKSKDLEFSNCGEIFAFYIINKYHGFGFGRKLFELARDELKKEGYDKMIIACLKGNPTAKFYEHMGGKYIKDGLFERLNLKEDIYYYEI